MRLTEKQKTFCDYIVQGMSGKDAYIKAYNSSGSAQNAYTEASRLMLRDDIQAHIKALRKPLEQAIQIDVMSEREKKKQIIWERIKVCMEREDDAAVARYMDILNKMDAEYININRNIDDASTDIKELDTDTLKKLSLVV